MTFNHMADYLYVFEHMIKNENGYILTNDPTDHGGMTHAGLSRKH